MSVVNNAVTVSDTGYYLVSYFASGSVVSDDFVTSLYLNGVPITNENIVQINGSGAGSKTALIYLPAGSALSLYNTSATEATLSSASITALKVSESA
jgi:hypothetical protein